MGQARAVKSIARAAGGLLLSPRGWIHPLAGLCGEGSRWLSSPVRQLTKAEGIHFPLPIPPLSTPLCSGRPQQGKGLVGQAVWGAAETLLGSVGIHNVSPLLLVIPHGRNAGASMGLARLFSWSTAASKAASVL